MHLILPKEIVILSAARTPVGRFDGSLSGLNAVDLGAIAIEAAVSRAGIDATAVDTVNMGIVVSSGYGIAPAKAAATQAGLPRRFTRARSKRCAARRWTPSRW